MIIRWLLAAALYLACAPLHAACTIAMDSGSFGTFSSFTVKNSGGEQQTSAWLTVSCTQLLGLLSTDSVTMKVVSATATSGSRAALKNGDNPAEVQTIPLRICGSASCNDGTETTIGNSYTWRGGALIALTSRSYRMPVYFRTLSGASVSAGRYRVTLTLEINHSICSLLSIAILCVGIQETGSTLVTPQLDMTITSDCIAINAPDINFGSAPLANGFAPVSQEITVSCTKGSAYSVGINNGANAGSGAVRKMKSGENTLSYDIYKGATSSRWGSIGAERWDSNLATGVSADGTVRRYAYTAKILTSRADTPPAGSYGDTLLVDITF